MNTLLRLTTNSRGQSIAVVKGDLTLEEVDAIVNAANSQLRHRAGVAGAIVRRGGTAIQRESDRIGYVAVGNAAMTTSGKLPCKRVIHAVGPRWGEGGEEEKLRNAIERSLMLAHNANFQSISIPAVSSGIFGFPKDKCAEILFSAALDFYDKHPDTSLRMIRFCNIDEETCRYFAAEFDRRFKEGGSRPSTSEGVSHFDRKLA